MLSDGLVAGVEEGESGAGDPRMMLGSSKQRTVDARARVLGEELEGVVGVRIYFRGKDDRVYW